MCNGLNVDSEDYVDDAQNYHEADYDDEDNKATACHKVDNGN